MAQGKVGRVVLLSVHPTYADAILDGRKTIEFRRRALPPDVWAVVIYATMPIGRIVGWFEIDGTVSASPEELWRDHGHEGCVERSFFDRYFALRKRGHGIRVKRSRRYHRALKLAEVSPSIRPPQSFQYLTPELTDALVWAREPSVSAV